MKAWRIEVCGEVQHVGFRRFVWSNAKRLGLNGYVRNLPKDCVEIIAQGSRELIDKLIEKIRSVELFEIKSLDVREVSVKEEYRDFEIM